MDEYINAGDAGIIPAYAKKNANMNMAEKYSAICRGACKEGLIAPQEAHPHTIPHHLKNKGKKIKQIQRNKKRKPKLNVKIM